MEDKVIYLMIVDFILCPYCEHNGITNKINVNTERLKSKHTNTMIAVVFILSWFFMDLMVMMVKMFMINNVNKDNVIMKYKQHKILFEYE